MSQVQKESQKIRSLVSKKKDIARFLYTEVPNRRLNEVSVNEIMRTDLIKVEQQTNLDICARMMLEKKISSIVVVDNEGELKGIITKSDMVEAYARHYPSKLKVDQYMTKNVITVSSDENLHVILLQTKLHGIMNRVLKIIRSWVDT
jgi:CBS domain-containing protein